MKNYLKELEQLDISAQDLDEYALTMQERAKKSGFSHPLAVYQSLVVDLALGAIETQKETAETLGKTHAVKQWLTIIVGGH